MFYFVRGYMFRSLVTIIRPLCESILKMLVTYWDPIKMTNSVRLTHYVLFCASYMFRSLVTIIRPLCESILKMLVTYWDPIEMTNSLRLTHHVLLVLIVNTFGVPICNQHFLDLIHKRA